MKLECNLCGEIVEADEFECAKDKGVITISCPNGCILQEIQVKDLPDVEEVNQ